MDALAISCIKITLGDYFCKSQLNGRKNRTRIFIDQRTDRQTDMHGKQAIRVLDTPSTT